MSPSMVWRPGSRVQRMRSTHSYGLVLLLVVTVFGFVAGAPDTPATAAVLTLLQSLTLLAALWTSGVTRRVDVVAVGVALAGLAGAVIHILDLTNVSAGLGGSLRALIVLGTCAVIIVGVVDQRAVNRQSILGAICVYLLIGILYTVTYGAIATLQAGSFFSQGTDGTSSLHLYFSFATLTTVGYGDYSAATGIGQTLAVTEALVGQLYLVTVVALLVSRLGPRAHVE